MGAALIKARLCCVLFSVCVESQRSVWLCWHANCVLRSQSHSCVLQCLLAVLRCSHLTSFCELCWAGLLSPTLCSLACCFMITPCSHVCVVRCAFIVCSRRGSGWCRCSSVQICCGCCLRAVHGVEPACRSKALPSWLRQLSCGGVYIPQYVQSLHDPSLGVLVHLCAC